MATPPSPQIVLYDLACTKNICFSPAVWRIRLLLNYKRIPYTTTFIEFPDIEPTLAALGIPPNDPTKARYPYTVPAIHHIPTDTHVMDSAAIAPFLEAAYPDPPLPLSSDLGRKIETKARAVVGPAFYTSLQPREMHIISPRAQEYFRRTREEALGHPLEDLIAGDREEKVWTAVADDARAAGELMQTNKDEGPFVLGAQPSFTDFFIAGALQNARIVHEPVWERCMRYPGYREVYEACEQWTEKKD
jgi:glutathione S-transferase